MCCRWFASDCTKRYELLGHEAGTHDVALSLDVVYHLVEDGTFEDFISKLLDIAGQYVFIHSSYMIESLVDSDVRHRLFTEWIHAHRREWKLDHHLVNAFPFDPRDPESTLFADFYVFSRVIPGDGDAS